MKVLDITKKKVIRAMNCVNDMQKSCSESLETIQRRVSAHCPAQWPMDMLNKRRCASSSQCMHSLSQDGVFVDFTTSVSAFEVQAVLGRGTFGSVHLARHKSSNMCVALKIIERERVEEMRQELNVFREQIVHLCLKHPFICNLLGTFQDSYAMYFVLEFCPGGELYGLLYDEMEDSGTDGESSMDENILVDSDQHTDIDEEEGGLRCTRALPQTPKSVVDAYEAEDVNRLAKKALKCQCFGGLEGQHVAFYSACVLLALEYLHEKTIMYRDIKLENIVLGADGYPRLVDFGLSKPDATHCDAMKSTTICGSMEYMAPELIHRKPYDQSVDFWSFGILMYELFFGVTPFYHPNHREQGRRITEDCVSFPNNFEELAPEAAALIRTLLEKSAAERPSSWSEVRKSDFFFKHFPKKVLWKRLIDKKMKAPFVPVLNSDFDSSLFAIASCPEYDEYDMC